MTQCLYCREEKSEMNCIPKYGGPDGLLLGYVCNDCIDKKYPTKGNYKFPYVKKVK